MRTNSGGARVFTEISRTLFTCHIQLHRRDSTRAVHSCFWIIYVNTIVSRRRESEAQWLLAAAAVTHMNVTVRKKKASALITHHPRAATAPYARALRREWMERRNLQAKECQEYHAIFHETTIIVIMMVICCCRYRNCWWWMGVQLDCCCSLTL